MSTLDAILTIATVAGMTFFTRFLPFALFGRQERPAALLCDLNRLLPAAVIAILVVYCLKNLSLASPGDFLPQMIAIAVVAALHIWKRSNLLSIAFGTACYMFLVQAVWP